MSSSHRTRAGRLRARFTLTHVQERADEHLRGRWQRRLDAGEEIWCWRCRLQGVRTRIDAHRWHLSDSARSPECPDCHTTASSVPRVGGRPATPAGSGSTR